VGFSPALGFCSLLPDRVGAYGLSFFLSESEFVPGFANFDFTSNASWSVVGQEWVSWGYRGEFIA
jgi:hypothetical protein